MTERAVIYARVSTQEQAEKGYSLAQQTERLRAWCAEHGFEVAEVVEERGVSGTVALLERPGFSRAFDLVAGGEASVVVAQDADRISRTPWHFGYLAARLEEFGATLRTLDDHGDDSPESEFFRDIRRGMAKMERGVTARRTRRGREQRAREGKVVGAASPPLGYRYNADRTKLVVDEERAKVVRRVFAQVAEGSSIRAVKKALEREGVETVRGRRLWPRPVIRGLIFNDLYRPHDRADLEDLVDRGQLSREVFERTTRGAAEGERWGVWFYGRDKTTRTGRLTAGGGPSRRFASRPREELIAVPVPDVGVPPEHVDGAREATRDNRAPSAAGHRVWELSGGIGFCACGRRHSTHRTARPHGTYHNYVCSEIRRNGSGACEHGRYHKAEATEGRVRGFVRGLLRNPEVLREKVLAGIDRERAEATLGSVEEETKHLHAELEKAREERAGYVRLAARGRIGDAELDGYLAENAERVAALEEALAALSSRREEARSLDRWAAMVDEYVADLADLADQPEISPVREHELVPADAGNPLVPTPLTPQTLRQRSDEETRLARREAQRSGGERWRALYAMLGLKVTAHRDGTLVLEWGAGRRTLRPGEPGNPGLLAPGSGLDLPTPPHLLPESSDSQRYRQARLRWGRQGSARASSFPASGRSGRP